MSDRFDFEEQLVKCWCVVDELKDLDECLFEGWIKFEQDTVSNYILGIANTYDARFIKLMDVFENEYMKAIRKNKMLEEECAALREQLQESDPDSAGYGIAAIKPKKKDKK